MKSTIIDKATARRIASETKAVRHLIRTMKKHQWLVDAVDDGEQRVKCRGERDTISAVTSVDESKIIFRNVAYNYKHCVVVILGNSGSDCLADHSENAWDNFYYIMDTEVYPYTEMLED